MVAKMARGLQEMVDIKKKEESDPW